MNETGHANAPLPPTLDTRGRVETRGDIVAGDEILFYEAVWNKRSKARLQTSPMPVGYRVIVAQVVWESYGPEKAKHSLTLRVRESSGRDPINPGRVIWRKNMQVSHNRCWRLRRSGEFAGEHWEKEKYVA